MADSDTTIDQITTAMIQPDVVINGNFNAASPAMGYGIQPSTTAALTLGFNEAVIDIAGTPTKIAGGTVALTASATNYVTRTASGTVTKVTSAPAGWPGPLAAGAIALLDVTTGPATILSYNDWRIVGGGTGLAASADEAFVTLTDGATVNLDADLGHNFYLLIGGNRTLANPTNLADGQVLTIVIKQDGTGTRTLAYGSKWKFPNATSSLSTAANAVDVIGGIYHSSLDLIFCTIARAMA